MAVLYSVTYSFAGYQAQNPSSPLPAAELDAELAGVQAAVAALSDALDDVRRSDGKLVNASVTYDSLDDQIKDLLAAERDVTTADIATSSFAAQPEAEAGVSNDKLMTPLRTAQAVMAQRPFATVSEAQAGSSATTVLSPARGRTLLDAVRAFASQVQAEAGTAADVVMSPLRVAQALAALRPRYTATASLTFGEILAGASATQTVSVASAEVGDTVLLGLPASGYQAGLVPVAYVSSANTVTLRITNTTGGALTPTSPSSVRFDVFG